MISHGTRGHSKFFSSLGKWLDLNCGRLKDSHIVCRWSVRSLLDGAIQIKPLAKRTEELGMTACAMTDHGNMFGAISFYNTMKGAG